MTADSHALILNVSTSTVFRKCLAIYEFRLNEELNISNQDRWLSSIRGIISPKRYVV